MTQRAVAPSVRHLRLSQTLSGYIARQFLFWFGSFLISLLGIILMVSLVDLLDRLATKNVSLGLVVQMALLKLPHLSQEVMAFIVLFASMTTFWRLTRSHELVVTRAAGISIWQFLLPVLAMAVLVGLLTATVLNPLASILLGRYDQLEANHIKHQSSMLAVSKTGLWLRQADGEGQSVIHAARVSDDSMVLHDVIVFRYSNSNRFFSRIDSRRARLVPGAWKFFDAWHSQPGTPATFVAEMSIETTMTREKIQESFAAPETISFWSLPGFIALMEGAGFSALRHKLQYNKLLALPVLFSAMILLAATFSLRPQRRGHVATMIMAGILFGFLLYFVSNFVFALGLSAKIPVVLAAWTPAGISLMLGVASLLHLEDG